MLCKLVPLSLSIVLLLIQARVVFHNLFVDLVFIHPLSASIKTRTRMALMAAENVVAGVRGKQLPFAVPVSKR